MVHNFSHFKLLKYNIIFPFTCTCLDGYYDLKTNIHFVTNGCGFIGERNKASQTIEILTNVDDDGDDGDIGSRELEKHFADDKKKTLTTTRKK